MMMSYEVELLKAWMDQGHRTDLDGTPIPPVMPDEWAAEMDPDGEAQAEFDAAPGPDDGRWYSWMPDIGHTEYGTSEEARADAESVLKEGRDPWPDDVECTEWGRLVPHGRAEAYDRGETPSGPNDFTVSYRMRAIRPDPKALPGGHTDAREAISEGAFSAEQIDAAPEPPPGYGVQHRPDGLWDVVALVQPRVTREGAVSSAEAHRDAVLASVEPTPTGEPTWNDATEALQRHIEQGYAAQSPQVQQALVKALDALMSDSRAGRKAKR